MDISFIIVLWIIISVIEAINSRKKTPPPPNDSADDFNFEIPNLNDTPDKPPQVQEINLAELYRQKKNAAVAQVKNKTENKNVAEEENKNFEIDMNSIILSEILDKPKALRKKKF